MRIGMSTTWTAILGRSLASRVDAKGRQTAGMTALESLVIVRNARQPLSSSKSTLRDSNTRPEPGVSLLTVARAVFAGLQWRLL